MFLGRIEILPSSGVFSPEDLFNVDASKLESLAAKNKALNEQIARLEQEREKEPVSKHAYFINRLIYLALLDSWISLENTSCFFIQKKKKKINKISFLKVNFFLHRTELPMKTCLVSLELCFPLWSISLELMVFRIWWKSLTYLHKTKKIFWTRSPCYTPLGSTIYKKPWVM